MVRLVIVMIVITLAIFIAGSIIFARKNPGLPQPIPFSHRIHAGTKQISCVFCHQSALVSSNAGMPSVEKCLLCHNVIASQWRPIRQVRDYYKRDEPIPWVRVNRVPDFVQFSHQAHLTNATKWGKRFDCSDCHGNVKAMDRISPAHEFTMGFCVDCHWKNNFSAACFTCHW